MLEFTVKGLDELLTMLTQLPDKLKQRAIKNALFDIRASAIKAIRDKFRGSKTGKVYKNSTTGHVHQASAPGEPPAIDSGDLDRSLELSRVDQDGLSVTIRAGGRAVAPYAGFLEEGTTHMEPRPFFFDTMEEMKDDWFKMVEASITEQLTKGGGIGGAFNAWN